MRSILLGTGSAIAGCLLSVSPGSVFSQVPQSDYDDVIRQETAKCALTDCVVGRAPVPDAPFSAEATTVWRPPAASGRPEMRATSRYYRDRAGRVRVEQGFVGRDGSPQRVFVTPDPNGPKAYDLDPTTRTAHTVGRGGAEMMVGGGGNYKLVLPLSAHCFISFFQVPADLDAGSPADAESLGQRSMGGVQTTGTRFAFRLPKRVSGSGLAERWVSPELKLVVYLRAEDPQIGIVEYELTRISLAEQGAEMFEVPADYAVMPYEDSVVWRNPYTLELSEHLCSGGL